MVALFLDDKKTNDDSDGKENGKKKKMFISTINNYWRRNEEWRPSIYSRLYNLIVKGDYMSKA